MAIVRPKKLFKAFKQSTEENINANLKTGVEQFKEKLQEEIKQVEEKNKNYTGGNSTQKAILTSPETYKNEEGNISGITLPDGRTFFGVTPQDVNLLVQQQEAKKQLLAGTQPVGTAQTQMEAAIKSQQLQQQVGQYTQLPTSQEPLLDVGQAFKQGLVSNVPKAASYAAGAAAVTGAGSNPASWGAATAVFVGTLAGGIISSFKSQRTDTISAQKKTLTEGKANLKDWSILAKSDPANKEYYLSQYNQQLAKIDQAYRQMKLDTQRDITEFEKALPDLAEFEAFYQVGGERQVLNLEMQNALLSPSSTEYELLQLSKRRGVNP